MGLMFEKGRCPLGRDCLFVMLIGLWAPSAQYAYRTNQTPQPVVRVSRCAPIVLDCAAYCGLIGTVGASVAERRGSPWGIVVANNPSGGLFGDCCRQQSLHLPSPRGSHRPSFARL